MAKKPTTLIEYRYDKADAWREYARTQVSRLVDHYEENARIENPGAIVRRRKI
jgi:hypothetical protein